LTTLVEDLGEFNPDLLSNFITWEGEEGWEVRVFLSAKPCESPGSSLSCSVHLCMPARISLSAGLPVAVRLPLAKLSIV
jgi:hypothetical protein